MTTELERYNNFRQNTLHARPIAAAHPRRQRSLQVSDIAWLGLQNLAGTLGYTHGSQSSISGMLEALGQGLLSIERIVAQQQEIPNE